MHDWWLNWNTAHLALITTRRIQKQPLQQKTGNGAPPPQNEVQNGNLTSARELFMEARGIVLFDINEFQEPESNNTTTHHPDHKTEDERHLPPQQ
eukprot:5423163-Amphidinium_carterae.1